MLLGLYERFLLPMGPNLLPCAQGLVLSVLPGLEEEQGESFAAALNLLDGVGGIVGPTRYFRMLLLLTLQSPTSRYAVLNVLLRRLPRLSTTDGMPHAALLAPPGTGAALKPPSPPPPRLLGGVRRTGAGRPTDARQFLGADPTLLVAAFRACLTDPNVLVQRHALELLTVHLPLDKAYAPSQPPLQRRLTMRVLC